VQSRFLPPSGPQYLQKELKENAFLLCPRWILALNHYHFSPGGAEKASPFFFLAWPDNGLFPTKSNNPVGK
jgi:hypothetical protein